MSSTARSGAQLAGHRHGLVPPTGLAHDLVALLLEGLAQVEADDGLVLGDQHAQSAPGPSSTGVRQGHRSASGVSSSSSTSWRTSSSAMVARTSSRRRRHGVGVAAGVVVLAVGQRRLRDEGADAGVVGLVGQLLELLLDDGQLLAEAAQALTDARQAALDQPLRHRPSIRTRPAGTRSGSRWRRAPRGATLRVRWTAGGSATATGTWPARGTPSTRASAPRCSRRWAPKARPRPRPATGPCGTATAPTCNRPATSGWRTAPSSRP